MKKRHELLMPAGSLEKAKYALMYGADAIYLGPKAYSLRARSSNFDIKEIKEIVNFAHSLNKKVYVVLNVICHNADIKNFENYFLKIKETKIDGVIAADPFIIHKIKQLAPDLEVHVSTQQSVTNSKACLFWKRNKTCRVVLAREVSLEELKLILKNLNDCIEIEYFIHGAVCISYSGRCMMSNNFSLRDANVGGCAQSCRWKYQISDDKNNKISDKFFTMSAKDMILAPEMKELLDLNVASFKVEGRMKSIHYVATVANCYRKIIDNYYQNITNNKEIIMDLKYAENRLGDTAWFKGNPGYEKMLYFELEKEINQIFAFNIEKQINETTYYVMARNYFSKKTSFCLVYPNFKKVNIKIKKIYDTFDNELDVVKTPMKLYKVEFEKPIEFNEYIIARSEYGKNLP